MYKFKRAHESFGGAKYPLSFLDTPEYEILTPEVERKILEFIDYQYVKRWGKELRIQLIDATPEFNLPATKSFVLNGVIITYAKVEA